MSFESGSRLLKTTNVHEEDIQANYNYDYGGA
jgi:hypothetical protein